MGLLYRGSETIMNELSEIEHNLALLVALEQSKMETMNELARCFNQLRVINTDFRNSAEVWSTSAKESQKAIQIMIEGLTAFDSEGKIRAFLEVNQIYPLWGKKNDKPK